MSSCFYLVLLARFTQPSDLEFKLGIWFAGGIVIKSFGKFGVWGLGFGVWGLGFGVWSVGVLEFGVLSEIFLSVTTRTRRRHSLRPHDSLCDGNEICPKYDLPASRLASADVVRRLHHKADLPSAARGAMI